MNPPEPAPASTRAERHALGRRLLGEGGALWSALPVEWGGAVAQTPAQAASGPQLPGFWWRVVASLGVLLRRPRASFAYVQEPVAHGSVLSLLHAVRLPLWAVLLAVLAVQYATVPGSEAIVLRPVHELVDPRLGEILSLWLLLMVPIGVPLLYFVLGVAVHVSLTLTGGAPRSIAASMRAVGYSLAPAMLAIAVLDVPLHLGWIPGLVYMVLLGVIGLAFFVQLGLALTGTHRIWAIRGFIVAFGPMVVVLAIQAARAILVLDEVPGWTPAPSHPYFVP